MTGIKRRVRELLEAVPGGLGVSDIIRELALEPGSRPRVASALKDGLIEGWAVTAARRGVRQMQVSTYRRARQ